MVLLIICAVLLLCYALLILYYWQGWKNIPVFSSTSEQNFLKASIIIPARNEERNIGALLSDLQKQAYPGHLTEIIVVDDHSEDNTAQVVQQFSNVRLIKLDSDAINSYKKKAIEKGIAAASGEWIITTDADCRLPANWLATMMAFAQERKAIFIAAPVVIDCGSAVVEVFQAMDFMVLQGITGAAVQNKKLSMCNGANLAYRRDAFYEVNGFEGVDHIASGDDMLLMHKIWKKYPDVVHYLKSIEAIATTKPVTSWKEFFNQRIRWASKATLYDDKRIFAVLLLVYLFNLCFIGLLIAGYWWYVLALLVAKTIVEFPLYISLATFFNKQWSVKYFFFFQPLHIIYTIVSGLFGQMGMYEWKGRRVR
jgi:poly-beta-1,6-N-acetyl-D-glucosamine synthase